MSFSSLLGIDVGTTGAKALLIDSSGRLLAKATTEYPLSTPRPLWAEQDPERWWEAAAASVNRVLAESGVDPADIAGVGLTGQMHGLVLLDAEGAVLRPAILWNDQRTVPQCAAVTEKMGASRVLELTGNPILPGFTAPKIAWVRENEPDVIRRVAKALLPKDYIRYRLTGEFFSEVSDASGTCLLNVANRNWSDEMLAAFEVPREWLPEVTESPEASARISTAGAEATGLKEGTPVAGGAGDQAAEGVGAGVVEPGIVSATLGTSGVVFAASESYRADPEGRLHAFCHAVPGMWHLMGVVLSAAGSFRWYRDTLGESETDLAHQEGLDVYDLLTESAAGVPAGCEGLLFLPYLSGERTPHPDPNARGVFFGLTLRHNKAHLTRAVLEGVTYAMRDSLELMRSLGIEPREVRASGGGGKSAFWRQMMADNFHSDIATVSSGEGAVFGAALLGGVASGVFADVPSACRAIIKPTGKTSPGRDAAVYDAFYPHYRSLYPALASEFAALGRTVENRSKN